CRAKSRDATETRNGPSRNRSLRRGSSAVSAQVAYVCDERAPSRRQTPGYELRKPGLRIARPGRREAKSAMQVDVPRSPLPEHPGLVRQPEGRAAMQIWTALPQTPTPWLVNLLESHGF